MAIDILLKIIDEFSQGICRPESFYRRFSKEGRAERKISDGCRVSQGRDQITA